MEKKREKYLKLLVGFLGVMLVGTGISHVITSAGLPQVQVSTAKQGFVTHAITAQGTVEKNMETGVYIQAEQLIEKVNVNIGDAVTKGDVLCSLSMEKLEENIAQKEDGIKKLQLQKDNDVAQKKATSDKQERDIRQATESYNIAVDSANTVIDNAKAELDIARDNLAIARANQEETSAINNLIDEVTRREMAVNDAIESKNANVLSAKQALENAQAETATDNVEEGHEIELEKLSKEKQKLVELKEIEGIIKAQIDGVITNVNVKTGELTGDTAVMLIANSDEGYRYTTQVSKEDNKHIAVGTEVTLTPSSGEQEIQGCKIESIITSEMDKTMLDVVVLVSAEQCRIGESLEMKVNRESKQYARCLPVSALFEENNEKFIYLLEEQDSIIGEVTVAKKHVITILNQNETTVAIAEENLTAGQKVIINTDRTIQNDSRVRVKADE